MVNILLVLCSEDAERSNLQSGLRGFFSRLLCKKIKMKQIENMLEEIEVNDNLKVYLLDLPYTILDKINKKYDNIFTIIDTICFKKGIERYYLPKNSGKLLFQALIVEILRKLYPIRTDISQLDIVLIIDDSKGKEEKEGNKNEAIDVLKMLYPITKFITVLTLEKTWFENELEDIYSNTGLSVSVISDFKKGLKNADIIINYGDIRKITSNVKLKPKAIIVDYKYDEINSINNVISNSLDNIASNFAINGAGNGVGNSSGNNKNISMDSDVDNYMSKSRGNGNIVINGLDIYIPPSIIMKLGRLIPKHFNSLELAEILIKSQISLPADTKNRSHILEENHMLQELAVAFKKGGYYIKGFKEQKLEGN